jgi:hypothetical protein
MAVMEGAVDLTNQEVEVKQGGDFSNKETRVFKPEANKTYRIKFTSPQVVMRRRHFNPQNKKYYRCLDHQGYCPICIAASNKVGEGAMRIKKASETFGANILVYKTDAQGQVMQPLSAEVYFWAFGADKFVQLRNIIQEWGPITDIDLSVTCTDAQFQKVTMTPAKNCHYNSTPEFKAACDKKIEEDSYPLDKFLCKEVPIMQMVQDFGLDVNSYIPQEILAQMSGGPTAQDLASSAQTQAPVAAQQAQPQQQAPVQQPNPAAAYTPPQPNGANFANLEDLTNLL